MDIEKQRGISVTHLPRSLTTMVNGPHSQITQGTRTSLAYLPTLMAVDAAVMVVDSAKGIEAQTQEIV